MQIPTGVDSGTPDLF